jgi:hypothetical protein
VGDAREGRGFREVSVREHVSTAPDRRNTHRHSFLVPVKSHVHIVDADMWRVNGIGRLVILFRMFGEIERAFIPGEAEEKLSPSVWSPKVV